MSRDLQQATPIPDIQSTRDDRNIAIEKVGVTAVSYPIQFASSTETPAQHTVASFDMFVSLPEEDRGTHMSRFLQVLHDWEGPLSCDSLVEVCEASRDRLQAEDAFLNVRFPYFVERSAPVSGETGKLQLQVAMEVVSGRHNDFVLTVKGPVTSLCPCSKQISDRGAHNQRCDVSVRVRLRPRASISVEELFMLMERSASAQVFPTLKRADEKRVTEDAYDNPKFVEDMVRDMAVALNLDARVTWYRCSSENFESIHQHNAFAQIERDKQTHGWSEPDAQPAREGG